MRNRKDSQVELAESVRDVSGESTHIPDGISSTAHTVNDVKGSRSKLYQHLHSKFGHLAFKLRAIYNAPQIAVFPVTTLLTIYGSTFYEKMGVPLKYITFFTALTRSLDLILDPFMSYFTDSFRGPMGRRRPFLFVGCWIYALMLILFLSPPSGIGVVPLGMWYGLTSVGYYVSYSFTIVPYDALGAELAASYHDRTLLYYTGAVFEFVGSIAIIGLSQLFSNNSTLDSSSCDSSDCYRPNGFGTSRTNFADKRTVMYNIFDVFSSSTQPIPGSVLGFSSQVCTSPDGTHFSNPDLLFTPNQCFTQVPIGNNTESMGLLTSHVAWTQSELANYHHYSWRERTTQCVLTYCGCVRASSDLCAIADLRKQYSSLSITMSVWFIITMCVVVYNTRERIQLGENSHVPKPSSPVPAMFNTLKNVPFRRMLPTFICDQVSYSIVTAMMLQFVKYIIRPEMQSRAEGDSIDCNNGSPVSGTESTSWRCNSSSVLGSLLMIMLASALCTCPLWYYATVHWGKRNIWIAWSWLLMASLFLLLAIGKGDIDLSLWLCIIPGATMGAKFVGLSILSDVIEYDEFLSGQRNEASYFMIKSFLPKICSIPAVTIPLIVLSRCEPYSETASLAVYIFIIAVPVVLISVSLYYKSSMPLRHKQQTRLMADGIGLHVLGLPAPDPITGIDYSLPTYSAADRRKIDALDHFPFLDDAQGMLTAVKANKVLISVALLIERARDQSFYLLILLACCLTGVGLTWSMFSASFLSIYPVLLSIASAAMLFLLTISVFRLRAASNLKRPEFQMSQSLLEKIVDVRGIYEKISRTRTVDIVGISESRRRLHMRMKQGLGMSNASDANIIGNADAHLLVNTDSDSDEAETLVKKSNRMVTKRKGDQVVNHWRAIINMQHLVDTSPNATESPSKPDRVSTSTSFSEILRGMADKISNNIPIQGQYSTVASKSTFIPKEAIPEAKNAKLRKGAKPIQHVDYMSEEAQPTVWDLELRTFVSSQADINLQRSSEDVEEDIAFSNSIGVQSTGGGMHLSESDSGSDSRSRTSSSSSSSSETGSSGSSSSSSSSSNK